MNGDLLADDVREPDAAFGFGRRICPGRYLAYESIWTAVACILAVFDISKAKDSSGNVITPEEDYEIGFAWCVQSKL